MYHVGRVIEVIPVDDKGLKAGEYVSYALLEMWDENSIIFRVNSSIAKDVKEGSFVLVDYSPVPVGGAPVPKHEIVAVLSEAKGKKVFSRMREHLENKKKQRISSSADASQFLPGKMIG